MKSIREPLKVAFDLLVHSLQLNIVQFRQVAVEHNAHSANEVDIMVETGKIKNFLPLLHGYNNARLRPGVSITFVRRLRNKLCSVLTLPSPSGEGEDQTEF